MNLFFNMIIPIYIYIHVCQTNPTVVWYHPDLNSRPSDVVPNHLAVETSA